MARPKARTTISVGQRLIRWDGERGYVDLTSTSKKTFGPGEAFQVVWLDSHGKVDGAEYLTLEQFEEEGVQWGRGKMPWAR